MKQGKLLQGIKSLSQKSPIYTYTYSTHTYNCKITELFKTQLQTLYPQITYDLILSQFQKFMMLPAQLLGKKSSGIMVSSKRKLCFKLLDQDSLNKIMQCMGKVMQYKGANGKSGLIDVLRIFYVESSKDNFEQNYAYMLMPSLRSNFQDVIAIYDIKGHTDTRSLQPQDFKVFKFGKDQNFIISKQLQQLKKIPKQTRVQFIKILTQDSSFLQSLNIIDYSLLLSFRTVVPGNTVSYKHSIQINENVSMEWAIIDYFQEYNQKKKAQNKFKSIFKKQVSSVQPELYSERFVGFMQKCLEV